MHPLVDGRTSGSSLVRALRGERSTVPPVWFMGQAGPSLPEHRAARGGADALDACLDPDLVSELSLQPVRRHRVDAAVLFSAVMVPVKLAGIDVRQVPGRGPVVDDPVRSAADVLRLRPIEPESLAPIAAAVTASVAELANTPLIVCGGAPFTLASYLIEGRPSPNHLRARAMMYADPHSWAALLNWCADVTGAYLRTQVMAGASVAQLMDPAMGVLSRRDYQRRVAPHSRRAFDSLRGLDVPRVHFGLASGDVVDLLPGLGATAVGVDWRTPLDEASTRLGHTVALQGNLDPALLAAPWPTLESHVRDVMNRADVAAAHVMNLGDRVPSGTDPDVLTRIVATVHGEDDVAP